MISIRINGEQRSYSERIESWINEQINRRRHSQGLVCVEVSVNLPLLNVLLRTPGCVGNGAAGALRQLTSVEERIFELWNHLGLNDSNFTSGQVIAFLKQLRRNT